MKLKVYVHAESHGNTGRVNYEISRIDMTEYYGPVVFHGDVEIPMEPVTPKDVIPAQVAILRKHQQEIRAEAEIKAKEIEEKISMMLALEFAL